MAKRQIASSLALAHAAAILIILSLCNAAAVEASWVSVITGVHIDVPAGTISLSRPHPEQLPQMLKNAPEDARDFFLNPLGSPLAFLIRQAKAQAANSAQPIPAELQNQLSPFFPPDILNSARFTDRADAGISIATTTLELNGNVGAITLDNIIVFDNYQAAQDPTLWAHELVHVSQYRNLGIDGFAAIYAGPGARDIENAAYSWQAHVAAILQQYSPTTYASIPQNWQEQSSWADSVPPTWQEYNQAAVSVTPASSCAVWSQTSINSLLVENHCPLGLSVTQIYVAGQPHNCEGPICSVPALESRQIVGMPGQLTNVTFVFQDAEWYRTHVPPGF